MLRWVRLLGGREFHLEDLLILWDGLFADNADLTLIDHICVAMLLFVRNDCKF
jgi:TBC1 domain family protein 5